MILLIQLKFYDIRKHSATLSSFSINPCINSIGKTQAHMQLSTFSTTIMKQACNARERYAIKYGRHAQTHPEHSPAILPSYSNLHKTNIANPLNSTQAFGSLSLVSSKIIPSTLLRNVTANRHGFPKGSWGASSLPASVLHHFLLLSSYYIWTFGKLFTMRIQRETRREPKTQRETRREPKTNLWRIPKSDGWVKENDVPNQTTNFVLKTNQLHFVCVCVCVYSHTSTTFCVHIYIHKYTHTHIHIFIQEVGFEGKYNSRLFQQY